MPDAPKQFRMHGQSRTITEKSWQSRRNGNHAMYNLWIWRKPSGLRASALRRDGYICQECKVAIATDVDHRIPHNGSMELFTDLDNLQSLCKSCHSSKTMRDQR